jgi:hypothetical protein
MEDFDDPFFDEERLATCSFYDKERDLIIQLITESVSVRNIQEMDMFYKELKPSIMAFWDNDLVAAVSGNELLRYLEQTVSFSERGPSVIAFLFEFWIGLENKMPPEKKSEDYTNYVNSLILARIIEPSQTYHETIGQDYHDWIRGIYDKLMEKAGLL